MNLETYARYYMQIAIRLAKQNLGYTYPNPSVGAIIVKNNQIIAKANTAIGGRPHAEKIAIDIAGIEAINSDMFVTLEPCCHKGVTAPCTDYIIEAGIKRVFIANIDLFDQVNGKGIEKLREHGIEVYTNILADEAKEINYGFFKRITNGLPQVTVKLATSIDGKIGLTNGESKWISCLLSRRYVHLLRSTHDAIMVGIGTVKKDNPSLDVRLEGIEESKIKIILDSNLQTDINAKFISSKGRSIIICHENQKNNPKVKILNDKAVEVIFLQEMNMEKILNILAIDLGITRLFVEGGAKVITSLLEAKAIDEFIHIKSPKLMGHDGIDMTNIFGMKHMDELPYFELKDNFTLDDDVISIYGSIWKNI